MASNRSKGSKPKSRGNGKGQRAAPALHINLTLDQKLDIFGIVFALGGLLTLLSLVSPSQGSLTDWWITLLKDAFGLGVFVVPLILVAVGVWLLLRSFEKVPRPSGEQSIGFTLAFFVALITLLFHRFFFPLNRVFGCFHVKMHTPVNRHHEPATKLTVGKQG